MGDTEQKHTGLITDAIYDILRADKRLNIYNIPELSMGNDTANLKELVRLSNEFIKANGGTGYHLSIHTDGGYNGSGASGFYYSDAGSKFGRPIYDEVCALTPWTDMSFKQRTGLYELNSTTAIAFLLEVSFHDRPEQAKWIHDNIQLIAKTIVKGLYKGLGLEPSSMDNELEKLKTEITRLQNIIANARKALEV